MFPDNLFNFSGVARERKELGICPKEEFREILELERARYRRTGDRSSLLVFDLGEKGGLDKAAICPLAHSLSQRTRLIDRAGWLDERRIGVLLPGTLAEGARKVATCISRQGMERAGRPTCRVYEFPSGVSNNLTEVAVDCSLKKNEARHPDKLGAFPRNAARQENASFGSCLLPLPLWKRSMDIAGAAFGLVALSPVFLIVGSLIKIASRGPVLYRQERVGRDGVPFSVCKFRTMHGNGSDHAHRKYLAGLIAGSSEAEDAGAAMAKMDDDPRIFPLGQLLRKSCIDELPQLINVLRGEMSLVGPRPPIPYEVEEYLRWHGGRFDVVPGMTGLWQVSGKNSLTFKEMVRLDVRYARECNFLLDLKIIFKTPLVILGQMTGSLKSSKLSIEGD